MLRTGGARRRRKTSKEERVCSVCGQDFRKAEHLARHFRSHTKEKPFQCGTCGRSYARQDTLLRHSRSHAEGELEAQESITLGASSEDIAPALLDSVNITSAETSLYTGAYADTATFGAPEHSSNVAVGPQSSLWPDTYGLNPEWPGWFVGNDFDLEMVNLSLLNPGNPVRAPRQSNLADLSVNVDDTNLKTDIQRKWHTAAAVLSGQTTPGAMEPSHQDDNTYRNQLEESLQPRVQTGILPSTAFLDLCTQAYFTQFHPIFPIIHAPTFRPSTQNSILLLSICSLGSLFLGSPRALAHGISMFERLNKAILASWDKYVIKGNSFGIVGLQAAILGQNFGLLVGVWGTSIVRPTHLAGIDGFHGSIISWARQAKLFQIEDDSYPNVEHVEGDALEIAWQAWMELEERKRLVLGLHIHDTELAKLNHHGPLLRHSLDRMPLLASEELFAAPTAVAWKSLLAKNKESLGAHAATQSINSTHTRISSTFQLCGTLESIRALALESRSDTRWGQASDMCQEMLVEWHNNHSSSLKSDPFCLLILWHATFMDLYADFDALECACGRDGEEMELRRSDYARTWAQSADATRCLLHAAMIQKHFESLRVGGEAPIHVPQALYSCGIAWTCYSRFGSRTAIETDMPEMQLLGINPSKLFAEVSCGIKWGRPESISLFKAIDSLERINHWKIAHSFATTLLALVEETQGLF